MKALIPLAGSGKRLRPFTYTQPKSMIPIAGKPIIGHIMDALLPADFEEYVFVVGYLGHKIRTFLEVEYPDVKMTFVQQSQQEGLGHAVWCAREILAEGVPTTIVLGDLIFDTDIRSLIKQDKSVLVTATVDDPREFGVVVESNNHEVLSVIEKPRIPTSNKALVGIYVINETKELCLALDELIANEERTHEEFQLTDAIQKMIENGVQFKTETVYNWFDCGRTDVLLDTNALLLKSSGNYLEQQYLTESNSIIIPPVYIGKGSTLINAVIGPDVTIGDNTVITSSIIKNTIIGNGTEIKDAVLMDTIIGNDSAVRGYKQRLNLGDNTVIDFLTKG